MLPRARIAGLVVTETAEGLHIHDTERQHTHTLHPLAALVWKHADGRTSVSELTAMAREQVGPDITDETIWSAIDSLTEANLLEGRLAPPSGAQRVGRRDLIRRVAVGSMAAAAIGAVMAPSAVSAQDVSAQEEGIKSQEGASKSQEGASKSQEGASKSQEGASKSQEEATKNPGGNGAEQRVRPEDRRSLAYTAAASCTCP